MNARILVVDDEPDIRFLLKDILKDEGYLVDIAEHAKTANALREANMPDLVLLDIWMPEVDGVTLLKEWKSNAADRCPVVMMSGHGTVETAVEATKFGAFDFVEKPLSIAKLLSTVKAALASSSETAQTQQRLVKEVPVGNSQIVRRLKQLMQSLRNSPDAVFFKGTNGSGRWIWASYLSDVSGSSIQYFNPQAPITLSLLQDSDLYIEEVTLLSPDQQQRLVQAIKENRQQKTGRHRFIVSSQFDHNQLSKSAKVLPELAELWRTAIHIPALDEHIEDIPELLEYYVNWYSENEQLPYRHFGVAAQNLLRNHRWSDDISELKQFIKKVLGNSENEVIELDEIERVLRQSRVGKDVPVDNMLQLTIDLNMDLREARETFEREYLSKHLALSGYNITELARRVGQERTHLYRKLKTLGLYNKKQS